MSFFYTNLKAIYNTENNLQLIMPLEPLHYILRDFFLSNIKDKVTTIDPLDFSFNYKIDGMKTINLFLTLSNHGLLKKIYRLECDECGEIALEDSIDKFYECFVCKHPLINLYEPNSEDLFNNISYVFELCEELFNELNENLKVQPSLPSEMQVGKEGNMTTIQNNLGVTEILQHTENNLSSITSEQLILNQQIDKLLAQGIKSIS